jgi:protein PhnA
MSKGFDQRHQRTRSLAAFGKSLARRARSRCELCDVGGKSLMTFELPPVPNAPEFDRCLMLCEDCATELGGGKVGNPERWRCLNNAVWSDTPAVQAAAVIVLRRLEADNPWAGELIEQLFLAHETLGLLGEDPPPGDGG